MSNKNILSSFACAFNKTKGRFFDEEDDKYRTCFQRDRDRIIHSGAFRKLEYKTQVFVNYTGDYYRTRLTHSLEVAQIARSICKRLRLNEDIAEAISLAHDLGHAPFGHAGEDALNEATKNFVGFDHNVQSLRILTYLEQRYIHFNGINPTWEVLEGIAKHNGPLPENKRSLITNHLVQTIPEYEKKKEKYDLKFTEFSSAEAQIASISDDIAYNAHDLDDGLRAKFFTVDDLFTLPLFGELFKEILSEYPNLLQNKITYEFLRRMINLTIQDIVKQVEKNIQVYGIETSEDIRKLKKPLVHFSPELTESNKRLKEFLNAKVYRHYKINRVTSKAKRIVCDLFNIFQNEPNVLPTEWSKIASNVDEKQRSIIVCDYIAGMTDRFAIQEHRRIFDTSYEMTSF